jgi:hypothetical protein
MKKAKDNYHTRDLFIETLDKLGCQYIIRSVVGNLYDIRFKFLECKFMANATNDSYDVDIWFPNWYHVNLSDEETCDYVKNLVNDLNFNCKSKFFYTTHEKENLLRLNNKLSFQILSSIPNIEDFVSSKIKLIISEQLMFVQEMEDLIEQVILTLEHDEEETN